MSTLKGKAIVVTGGAGFIGSHVVDALVASGYRVSVIDDLSTGKRKNVNPSATLYKMDIRSPEVSKVFKEERPAYVFHYAAQANLRKSIEDPIWDARINIIGSLNVFGLCREYGVKKIVFASTGGAMYGESKTLPTPETHPSRPTSPYGIAKLAAEHYLSLMRVPFVVLRFANVYGPRQNAKGEAGVIAIFTEALMSGKAPLILGTGKQTRDFVFVEDAVRASVLAFKSESAGVFNVGTGKEHSINGVLQSLQSITRSSLKVRRGVLREGELRRSCLDSSKMRRHMGWKPEYNLERGLEKTVESFR